jgi:Lon protease-like protein
MAGIHKLPLFPLNTVLFPGMVLPLHIFEPRYRLMIGRCIQQNTPFGVVLIREGEEVGEPAQPYEIGTSAFITNVRRLPDGRMDIQTIGYERFRIRSVQQTSPYMVGLVEDYPLSDADSPEIQTLAAGLAAGIRRYLSTIQDAAGEELAFGDVPDQAASLAFYVAIVLPLPPPEKQRLLSTDGVRNMLAAEQPLMSRELMLLDHMIAVEQRRSESDMELPFSLN